MNAVPCDTLKLAEGLEAGGFSAEQARTFASALADAASSADVERKADLPDLAKKSDIVEVKAATKADLLAPFGAVATIDAVLTLIRVSH